MNTIVIAAIVLIVLVVLIMIFTGNIGGWTGDVDETETSAMARAKCIGKIGQVKLSTECSKMKGYHGEIIENLGTGLVCCVKDKAQSETDETQIGTKKRGDTCFDDKECESKKCRSVVGGSLGKECVDE